DVYAGAPVVIFGRYRGAAPPSAAIEVEGTSLGDPLRMTVALAKPPQASTWLAASWARAHIRDLEDRYAAGGREVEPQIVRVSKQFSVLSRFTAFVAIDRSEVVNKAGVLHQVVQPVEMPAGWSAGPTGHFVQGRTMIGAAAPLRMAGYAPPPAGSAPPPVQPSNLAAASMPSLRMPFGPVAGGPPPGFVEGAPPPMPPRAAPPRPSTGSPAQGVIVDPALLGRVQAAQPPQPAKLEANEGVDVSAAVNAAYLQQLAALAVELDAQASGRCDPAALRLLRQRLTQWVEDLRSVAGNRDLASAVEALVKRLSDALAAAAGLSAEVAVVAEELAKLASAASPPEKKSRADFWK
ncbi:MAG TPA: hypothetical protein VF469_02595, partial [Kofleriaceae bacterium]